MITTVFGGVNSGKSQFAEEYVSKKEGSKYYIATMRVVTDEDKERVTKHRALREGKDFVTIEQDIAIVRAMDKIKWMDSLLGASGASKQALIECLPTLCANEMFLENGDIVPHKDVENTILCGLAILKDFFCDITIVSDENPDVSYYGNLASYNDEQINEYKEAMKELNAAMKTLSDECINGPFNK